MATVRCLSLTVVKVCVFDEGMVVLRSMRAREEAAFRLDSQGQRRDIEQHNVLHVAGQHSPPAPLRRGLPPRPG